MTIQKRKINDFIKNVDNIKQVKYLIYESFKNNNISTASDTFKKLMEKIYSKKSSMNDTIDYRKNNTDIFTYHNNQKIIGVLISKKNKITHLFVDINNQNKGIGKSLLFFFEEKIKKEGYTSIYLKPSVYADAFYRKYGFISKDDIYLEKHI